MNKNTVRQRIIVSAFANAVKALAGFSMGIIIARSLSPVGYGDLFFLIGSFTAICALLDMGTSSAFYTFISKSTKNQLFYYLYFCWLILQFLLVVLVVSVFLPRNLVDKIWLGQSGSIILAAFVAQFAQQRVWPTVVQICEARRKTVLAQLSGVVISVLHLLIVLLLIAFDNLTIESALASIFSVYVIASIVIFRALHADLRVENIVSDVRSYIIEVMQDYWKFCRPLILVALFSFLYEFADRWLLQLFGGSEQQGFYQISARIAAVSLIATASMLSIFWKEVADSYSNGDMERVGRVYHRVTRALYLLVTIVACFLIPWSEDITKTVLGDEYREAWPVLAVMLFYPIHQSIGQINATMFLASERTDSYMRITLFGMIVSMPASYFVLALPSNSFVPGLGLGALGIALKMVVLNFSLVNLQSWLLSKYHHWKFDWLFQVIVAVSALLLSYAMKWLGTQVVSPIGIASLFSEMILTMAISGATYLLIIIAIIWIKPEIAGTDKQELQNLASSLLSRIRSISVGH
jgi:O-antigen/teichoic acid export membrane protein